MTSYKRGSINYYQELHLERNLRIQDTLILNEEIKILKRLQRQNEF